MAVPATASGSGVAEAKAPTARLTGVESYSFKGCIELPFVRSKRLQSTDATTGANDCYEVSRLHLLIKKLLNSVAHQRPHFPNERPRSSTTTAIVRPISPPPAPRGGTGGLFFFGVFWAPALLFLFKGDKGKFIFFGGLPILKTPPLVPTEVDNFFSFWGKKARTKRTLLVVFSTSSSPPGAAACGGAD